MNDTGRRLEYTQRVIANIARQAEDGPVVLNANTCWDEMFLKKAIIDIMFDIDHKHGLTIAEQGENFIITKNEVSK